MESRVEDAGVLIAVFGPPCPLTKWGLHLLRTIATHALGDHDFIGTSSLDRFKTRWLERTHEHTLYFADCPERGITEIFTRIEEVPIFLFTESARDIAAIIMQQKNISLPDAVRSTGKHLAALHDIFLRRDTYIFKRPARSASLRKTIELLAKLCGLQHDRIAVDAVITKLGLHLKPGEDMDILQAIDQFAPDLKRRELNSGFSGVDQLLLQAAIDPFENVIIGQELAKVTWPRGLFCDSDRKGAPLGAPIELVGQSRQLTYGPYLYLPRGHWKATFFLTFANSRSTNTLRADVLCNAKDMISVGDFETVGDGNFSVELPFQVEEPTFPLEARLSLRGGAIEGRLDLLKIEIRRNTFSVAAET